MQKSILSLCLFLLMTEVVYAQVQAPDFVVNEPAKNLKGLGRPDITAHTDGTFAMAWQDYNDYSMPVAEQPRAAVQIFSASVQAIGPLNLFRGESRSLSIWTSDYVWADTRTGLAGDIFSQRFDASGQPLGGNLHISAGEGEIYDSTLVDGSN